MSDCHHYFHILFIKPSSYEIKFMDNIRMTFIFSRWYFQWMGSTIEFHFFFFFFFVTLPFIINNLTMENVGIAWRFMYLALIHLSTIEIYNRCASLRVSIFLQVNNQRLKVEIVHSFRFWFLDGTSLFLSIDGFYFTLVCRSDLYYVTQPPKVYLFAKFKISAF